MFLRKIKYQNKSVLMCEEKNQTRHIHLILFVFLNILWNTHILRNLT